MSGPDGSSTKGDVSCAVGGPDLSRVISGRSGRVCQRQVYGITYETTTYLDIQVGFCYSAWKKISWYSMIELAIILPLMGSVECVLSGVVSGVEIPTV